MASFGRRATSGRTHNMKTIALLFKIGNKWALANYKGDTLPTLEFATAKEAREYAKTRKIGVLRDKNCDGV
jgi:hypothetical protein